MKPRIVTYRGREIELVTLAAEKGIPVSTLRSRIERFGWTVEDAAETPVDRRFRRGGRHRSDRPRPVPKLERHHTGRAFARWSEGGQRRSRWFGEWGTDAASQGYARFAAEWASSKGIAPPDTSRQIAIAELCERVADWAAIHYRKDGKPTSEVNGYLASLVPLVELYGDQPANSFTPPKLVAVRHEFVRRGLSRNTANRYTGKIIRTFSKGVEWGLFPASVVAALREVDPLARGRTEAHDPPPKRPANVAAIEATLSHMHADAGRARVLAAMVRVQLLTGMRPGELCAMRPEMIDRNRSPWCYDVARANKTLHRGKTRLVYIGPRARENRRRRSR